MTVARVAVEVGGATVRVAAAGPGEAARFVAALPAEPGRGLADVVAGIVGPAPPELVLVHPAGWPARRVREAAGPVAGVRPVAAPVAATHGGNGVVLDVGRSGAGVAVVRGGRVVAHRSCDTGGARLDREVAAHLGVDIPDARRVREGLSLQPVVRLRDGRRVDAVQLEAVLRPVLREIVDLLQAVLAAAPATPGPVLMVGGVARAPLLAEVVDAAGVADAVVAPRPDAAAVLGALALPPLPVEAAHPEAMAPQPRLLPPVPRPPPRRLRRGLMGVAGVGVAGALLGAGSLLPGGSAPAAVPSGVLVQYGYRLDVPSGWEHTGGLPERRRSLLTPAATPDGSDLIAVERTPLGYDSAAEPDRAHAELRAVYDAAVAAGSPLSGFADGRVRGRAVTIYQQRDGGSVVEWFVVLDGDAQLSVGCRHTPAGTQAVRAACEVVVGSIRRS